MLCCTNGSLGENQEFKSCQKSECHATTNYCQIDQNACDVSIECSEGCFCATGFLLSGDGSCLEESACDEEEKNYNLIFVEIESEIESEIASGVDRVCVGLVLISFFSFLF